MQPASSKLQACDLIEARLACRTGPGRGATRDGPLITMTNAPSSAAACRAPALPSLLGPWLALGVGLAGVTAMSDSEPLGAVAAAELTPMVRSASVPSPIRLNALVPATITSAGTSPATAQLLGLDELLVPNDPTPLPAPARLDRLFSVSGQPVKELPPGYHHQLLEPELLPDAATESPEGGPSAAQWRALRQCESSNNYSAVNPSGKYRGAYQFDLPTWESVGGSGDPAAAPPHEQDHRALLLYQRRGAAPWPICGRHLR